MIRYKFKQVNMLYLIPLTLIDTLLFQILKGYYGIVAMLPIIGLSIILINRLLTSKVEYTEAHIVFTKPFKKSTIISYQDITRVTFLYNRMLTFTIYLGDKAIVVPTPARLPKVEELYSWLSTKNPSASLEIIKPAQNESLSRTT